MMSYKTKGEIIEVLNKRDMPCKDGNICRTDWMSSAGFFRMTPGILWFCVSDLLQRSGRTGCVSVKRLTAAVRFHGADNLYAAQKPNLPTQRTVGVSMSV